MVHFGGRWHQADLVALCYVVSSQIRDQTCVICTGRQILYHWATREGPQTLLTLTWWLTTWVLLRSHSYVSVETRWDGGEMKETGFTLEGTWLHLGRNCLRWEFLDRAGTDFSRWSLVGWIFGVHEVPRIVQIPQFNSQDWWVLQLFHERSGKVVNSPVRRICWWTS